MQNTKIQSSDTKTLHHNAGQLLYGIVRPKMAVLKIGRAWGKTYGPTADFIANNVRDMPGSVGAIGTDSYKHLRTIILGELEKKWNARGMLRGRDYWFEKFPPEELNVPSPIRPIIDPKGCFFFRNGSALKTYSFNFNSLPNGDSVDYMAVEELKLVNPKRLGEAARCVRGNDEFFGHLSCHGSKLYVTDTPSADDLSGQHVHNWDDLHDEDRVKAIVSYAYYEQKAVLELEKTKDKKKQRKLKRLIKQYRQKLNYHRSLCTFVMEGSSVSNLHAIGYSKLRSFLKDDTIETTKATIFSIKPTQFKNGFYSALKPEDRQFGGHGYVAIADDHLSRSGQIFQDCRADADLITSEPLAACLDYNKTITCMVVGQLADTEIRFQNNFWVEMPKKVKHVARAFCKYYAPYPTKILYYAYDHTADAQDAVKTADDTYKAEFTREVEAHGWTVIEEKYRQTWHKERFDLWNNLLSGEDEQGYTFGYNMENCREWARAAQLTKIKMVPSKYDGMRLKKDKSAETSVAKSNISRIEQPHITEAGDGLLIYLREQFSYTRSYSTMPVQ